MKFYINCSEMLSALNLLSTHSTRLKANNCERDYTVALISNIDKRSIIVCSHIDAEPAHLNITVAAQFSSRMVSNFAIALSGRLLANFIQTLKPSKGVDIEMSFDEMTLAFFRATELAADLFNDKRSIQRTENKTVHRQNFEFVRSPPEFLLSKESAKSVTTLLFDDIQELGSVCKVMKSITNDRSASIAGLKTVDSQLIIYSTRFQVALSSLESSERIHPQVIDANILNTLVAIASRISRPKQSPIEIYCNESFIAIYTDECCAHIKTLPTTKTPRERYLPKNKDPIPALHVPILKFAKSIKGLCEPSQTSKNVVALEQLSPQKLSVHIKNEEGESLNVLNISSEFVHSLLPTPAVLQRSFLLNSLELFRYDEVIQIAIVRSDQIELVMTNQRKNRHVFLCSLEDVPRDTYLDDAAANLQLYGVQAI